MKKKKKTCLSEAVHERFGLSKGKIRKGLGAGSDASNPHPPTPRKLKEERN